jgi:transposase
MHQSTTEADFAAFIGIDWSDSKHDFCLHVVQSGIREAGTIEHTPEAIAEWANSLRRRFRGQPVAVCLELSKGPLINALREYDTFVLFPVNPLTVARFREAFATSRAKDDPSDAELQLELLLKHRDRLQPLAPSSPALRRLAQLVENRRRLVGDKVRLISRLRSVLKNYYPQPLQWFDDCGTILFCDFLSRWPTLKTVQRTRSSTLQRFFHAHHVRSASLIERRAQAIRAAIPLTTDEAVIAPNALLAEALVDQLRVVLAALKQFDETIADVAESHPDFPLFDGLPGAGPALAPRLLVAFGDERRRFGSATDVQKYSGIAPVTERSGNQWSVHCRWRCPKFLRQTFVEWAGTSIPYSFWARAFYEQKRAQGKSHHVAIRALAYKWIRIVFRCWQDRRPYNESVYLAALQKRGSPLIQGLAGPQ